MWLKMAEGSNPETRLADTNRGVYGLLLYVGMYFWLAAYITWAVVPDQWLHSVGLTFLPTKYWAIAVPVYGSVAVVVFLCVYVCYSMRLNVGLEDTRTLTDDHAIYSPPYGDVGVSGGGDDEGIAVPALTDIPITLVNRKMFSVS